MAFLKLFPVVPKQPARSVCMVNDLPSFNKMDFCNRTVIGLESFGKVMRVSKDQKVYVIKEFNNVDTSDLERKLTEKEARLLKSLTGCDNIVTFYGYSSEDCNTDGILLFHVRITTN